MAPSGPRRGRRVCRGLPSGGVRPRRRLVDAPFLVLIMPDPAINGVEVPVSAALPRGDSGGAPTSRRLPRRPGSSTTAPSPPTSPRSTTRAERRRAPRRSGPAAERTAWVPRRLPPKARPFGAGGLAARLRHPAAASNPRRLPVGVSRRKASCKERRTRSGDELRGIRGQRRGRPGWVVSFRSQPRNGAPALRWPRSAIRSARCSRQTTHRPSGMSSIV